MNKAIFFLFILLLLLLFLELQLPNPGGHYKMGQIHFEYQKSHIKKNNNNKKNLNLIKLIDLSLF